MSDLTDVPDAAVIAVLTEMDWPDDREFSAHVEPDGYELTPPGAYWDTASDIARAVIAAVEPTLRADERAKVAEEIEALAIANPSTQWENGFQERGWNYAIQEAVKTIKAGLASCPPDPSHGQNEAIPGEQTPDGTDKGPESPVETRTGAGTSKDTNPAPKPAQTV